MNKTSYLKFYSHQQKSYLIPLSFFTIEATSLCVRNDADLLKFVNYLSVTEFLI